MDQTPSKTLEIAINAGDLEMVKAWVAKFGIETHAHYPVPGAAFDAYIFGTPFALAVHQAKEELALWLLQNGASHESYGYGSEAGYRQHHSYHPLGPAVINGLDSVVKLMLEQGVNFRAEQNHWVEEWDAPEFRTIGKAILAEEVTRPLFARIGRLDVLAALAKQDLRIQDERKEDEAALA